MDPQCPTKEYNACLGPPPVRRRKSLSNILDTRKEWSVVRKNINNSVDEALWRVDMEKVGVCDVTAQTEVVSYPHSTELIADIYVRLCGFARSPV